MEHYNIMIVFNKKRRGAEYSEEYYHSISWHYYFMSLLNTAEKQTNSYSSFNLYLLSSSNFMTQKLSEDLIL
jgi:hypothetical protein